MTLFDHHRAKVPHLRAAAMDAAKAADAYGSIVSAARRRTVVAMNEMEGPLLLTPVEAASTRVTEQAATLAGAALLLEGAATVWADAVEDFNRSVDDWNDQWQTAVTMDFGVPLLEVDADHPSLRQAQRKHDNAVAAARAYLLHDLRVKYEKALDELDRIARSAATTLRGAPSVESLAFYAHSGGLRDSAALAAKHDDGCSRSVTDAVFDPSWSDYTNLAVDLSKGVPGPFATAMGGAADRRLTQLTDVVNQFHDFDAGHWRPGSPWWEKFDQANTAWRRAAGLAENADKGKRLFEFLNKPITDAIPKASVADGIAAGLTVIGIGYDYFVQHESLGEATVSNVAAGEAVDAGTVAAGESVVAELGTDVGMGALIGNAAPIVGPVAGAVVGALVGAYTYERSQHEYESHVEHSDGDESGECDVRPAE